MSLRIEQYVSKRERIIVAACYLIAAALIVAYGSAVANWTLSELVVMTGGGE